MGMGRRGASFKRDYSGLLTAKDDLLRRLRNANPAAKELLDSLRLPWYDVRNEANTDDTEVFIYDEIGGWFGTPVEDFVKDLNGIKTKSITVRINSPGGSLFDSIAIYNTLVKHPANVTVYVDALAASGASIIAMAGDKTIMMVGSQLMIHDALGVELGNAADMRAMAKFLDGQSENIATIYKAKAGNEPEGGWRRLMLAETWMFAEEAVALGLADEVYSTVPDNAFPATDPDEESDDEEDEEGEEESTEDSEESDEDDDSEEDEIENLMNHKHRLVNRGWKHAGRTAAPAPPVRTDWQNFVDSILT
jgi:ATP-dependent protease ClpP protease subunit